MELSGSRFAEINRIYRIDHKILEKLFKNKRTVRMGWRMHKIKWLYL